MIEDALNLVAEPNSVFERFKICFYLKLFFMFFLLF